MHYSIGSQLLWGQKHILSDIFHDAAVMGRNRKKQRDKEQWDHCIEGSENMNHIFQIQIGHTFNNDQ